MSSHRKDLSSNPVLIRTELSSLANVNAPLGTVLSESRVHDSSRLLFFKSYSTVDLSDLVESDGLGKK